MGGSGPETKAGSLVNIQTKTGSCLTQMSFDLQKKEKKQKQKTHHLPCLQPGSQVNVTHGIVSPAKDTGFPTQELFAAKLELVLMIRHSGSCPLFPSLPGLNPKMTLTATLLEEKLRSPGKGDSGPGELRHGHRRLRASGSHPSFPSWCSYIFLETHSILLPLSLQLTHDLRRPPSR